MTTPAEPSGPTERRFRRMRRASEADVTGRGARLASSILANSAPILVLAVWWLASDSTADHILPSPPDVAEETVSLLVGDRAGETWTSMQRIVISVVLAMTVGGVLVFLARLLPITRKLVGERIVPFFNSVPALGWAILGVIWFGVGDFAVIVVVTAIVVPFCMVNLWEGMRNLDLELLEMGRSFTRSRTRVLAMIEAPLVLPYVLAAARLSFSVGWKVALIAEFFGASSGLGLVMNRARQSFDSATVFASIVVVMVIVVLVDRLVFDPLSRWFARRTGASPQLPASAI